MTVSELRVILQTLEEEGKGAYDVLDADYMNIIEAKNIEIDNRDKEIIL